MNLQCALRAIDGYRVSSMVGLWFEYLLYLSFFLLAASYVCFVPRLSLLHSPLIHIQPLMASIRSFIGILRSRSTISSTKNVVTRSMVGMQQRLGQEQARRHFTAFAAHAPSNQYALYAALAAGLLTAAGVYSTNARWTYAEEPSIQAYNYQDVYDAIAERLIEEDDYDDGSYGPVVLRLAWHASGTYDAATGTGGSNGATMRFAPESEHGANSGLKAARDFLEPIKEQFPSISYSDLWTLSAVCAVQEVGGPTIPWRPGRKDRDVSFCSPDGMLPDGSKSHVRFAVT